MQHNFKRQVSPLQWNNLTIIFDKAKPHVSRETTNFLEKKAATLLRQPPYSPNFNLCDRFVFWKLESGRPRDNFESQEDLQQYLQSRLRSMTSVKLQYQFQYLKNDLVKIIECHGDYL